MIFRGCIAKINDLNIVFWDHLNFQATLRILFTLLAHFLNQLSLLHFISALNLRNDQFRWLSLNNTSPFLKLLWWVVLIRRKLLLFVSTEILKVSLLFIYGVGTTLFRLHISRIFIQYFALHLLNLTFSVILKDMNFILRNLLFYLKVFTDYFLGMAPIQLRVFRLRNISMLFRKILLLVEVLKNFGLSSSQTFSYGE